MSGCILSKSALIIRTQSRRHRFVCQQQTHFSSVGGERLRVAIVGGGAAGLSSALHLAPLVEKGLITSPIDVYEAPKESRDIGVGLWSTALDAFRLSDRPSHKTVYDEMTSRGSWIGDAGYRTPSGSWLMKSHLPVNMEEAAASGMPALLFLREKDMLLSLKKAVHWEQQHGMVQIHSKTPVNGLLENSSRPWSTNVMRGGKPSDRDYHLILAADGTHSALRQEYGGHDASHRILTGTYALPSPNDLPNEKRQEPTPWDEAQRQISVGLQDRNYTVFRGNAPLTQEDIGMDGTSFQTWGEGQSMRFATVPMHFLCGQEKVERQVWFITIDDKEILKVSDPAERQEMLLNQFKDWHDPICQIVESTPAEEILMERAVAHRHCIPPVTNFNRIVQKLRGVRPPNSGDGPCVVFVGDAYMTVDPILAQGFTVAMEGAVELRNAVEKACRRCERDPALEFDPAILREALMRRHTGRMDRLICLLRATELVQALGQPSGVAGAFNTKLLRPLVKLVPNMIKAPIFDSVLKYSLGVSSVQSEKKDESE